MRHKFLSVPVVLIWLVVAPWAAHADPPWAAEHPTKYLALGDSLAAGYKAIPVTKGYVYELYREGAFDTVPHTLFANAAVPGATSAHVLQHQVPQAIEAFRPDVITLTVGGNDLLRILDGANPGVVLAEFQSNLTQIFLALRTALPTTRIYVSNLYTVPQIAGADQIVPFFNQIVAGVAAVFGVPVADVYAAFLGRHGLLLIERQGADPFEVHPTNKGYREIARAFEAVIK